MEVTVELLLMMQRKTLSGADLDATNLGQNVNAVLPLEKVTKVLKDKIFMCKKCSKEFGRHSHLKRHVCKESADVKIRTSETLEEQMSFNNDNIAEAMVVQPDISLHEFMHRKHTVNRNFICVVCGKCFRRNSHLKRHLQLHINKKKLSGTVRKEIFLAESLKVDLHNESSPFTSTTEENLDVSTEEPVLEDMVEVVNDPIQPTFSNEIFQNVIEHNAVGDENSREEGYQSSASSEYTEPKAISKAPINKNLICSVCGKGFGRNSHLKRHRKLHVSSGELYYCGFCEKSFMQSCYLKNHINMCHLESNPEGRRFFCEICSKSFMRSCHLKKHLKLHTNFESHECDVCGKRFSQICYLKAHVKRVHGSQETLDKIYDCSICAKKFGRMSHLKRHIKLHIGGPTFDCDICGKKFLQNGNLKVHIRMVHSQERSFKCTICSKMFPQRSNLNTHMRIHTGEKPYPCNICGRGFSQGIQLKTHLRTHSGEKPFSCSICGKKFTNKRGQMKHEFAHSQESFKKRRQQKKIIQDRDKGPFKFVDSETKEQKKKNVPLKFNDKTVVEVKEEPDSDEMATENSCIDSENDINDIVENKDEVEEHYICNTSDSTDINKTECKRISIHTTLNDKK